MPTWHPDLGTAKVAALLSSRPILLYTWSPG
jgi:hypothetical protein